MYKIVMLVVLVATIECGNKRVEEVDCKLMGDADSSSSIICKLNEPNAQIVAGRAGSLLPLKVDGQNLMWVNKYQPASSRWSDLCPSKYLLTGYQYRPSVCLNQHTCDQTGRCKLGLNVTDPSRQVYVNLIDDLNKHTEIPKLTPDLKFINVSIDLSTADSPATEYTLIDGTDKLDPYRSKPNRALNQFRLESLNDELSQYGADTLPVSSQCKTIAAVPFSLRYDNELERLHLIIPNDIRSKLSECYLLSLIVKRRSFDDQIDLQSSLALVYITVNENRVDRPMFDQSAYNFTIDENMPLNHVIGSVRAVYEPTKVDENGKVNYRIVPFVSDVGSSGGDQLPVRIDPTTGSIIVKSYIDREKFADNLVRFNVESSFGGTSYSYAMVNLLIRDLNDNAPVPRIRPVGSFAKSFSNEQQQQPSLYVNEDTPVNQILAYVGVYDPDAGENGTIKSVELTMINLKKPSQRTVAIRQAKLDQLKRANVSHTVWHRVLDELTLLSSSAAATGAIPFRLNKIGDKLFTIQLTRKLNFNLAESYSVEMKIQDNGTRPQLESKTRINLNVLGNNRYAPVFLNSPDDEVQLVEGFGSHSWASSAVSNDSWPRVVYKFTAVDLDDEQNGLVRYKFANNPLVSQLKLADNVRATTLLESTFELDRDSGELRQLAPLDREDFTSDTIEFVVTAQDQAEPVADRLTSSSKLRVKIGDVNDNKPVFGGAIVSSSSSRVNIRASVGAASEERFLKIASSIDLTDADAYETNSANYLNVNLNRAKESLFENTAQLGEHFKFDHLTCYKTFNLELVEQNSSTLPVVVLVENDDDLLINYVHCKLSLWLDVTLLRQMKGNLTGSHVFDLTLRATDYGVNGADVEPSTLDVHIELDFNSAQVASETIELDLDAKQPVRLNLKDHFSTVGSVSRLEDKSAGHVDVTRKFKVNRELNTLDWDQEPGVYLIDLFYADHDQLTLNQILLIAYDQQRPKNNQQHQLVTYKKHITGLLESTEPKFKLNLDRLGQFQSLLLGTGDRFLLGQFQNSTSMFSLLINNRSTFLKFISVTLLVSFVVLALFIFCILLIIRRNFCSAKKKNMNEDQSRTQSNVEQRKKDLNVIDDTDTGNGKFARLIVGEEKCVSDGQNTSVEKVNRYLETLPDETFQQSSSPASSSSMVDSNKNLIIPVEYYQNSKQPSRRPAPAPTNPEGKQTSVCTLSTTSSSCISDEGCYGSSDFSSEKDSKRQLKTLMQQQQQQQQFVVYNNGRTQTPTLKYHQQQHQQNYYINNLSRFEKIYNNDSCNRIYCENYARTNTTAVVTSSSSPTSDLVVDLNVKSNDHRLSPYLVKPSSSSSASSSSSTNSSILSNPNNVQVVTSISGSYV